MDYPTLQTARLGELDHAFYYAAECQDCHYRVRLSLVRLRSQLGDDFPLIDLRSRLKCSQCGSRRIVIAYFTPAHSSANLRAFFDETPV